MVKSAKQNTEEKPVGLVKESYKDAYEKAKKAGKINRPTYQIHTWNEDNSVLVGKVRAVSEFTGGKFDNPVKQYLIDTDDGAKSCILGSYTDTQLESVVLINRVVAIIHQGKKDLEDGRSVNIFDVEIIDV